VTLALHVAPGDVTATSVALAPWLTDAGRLVMWTESEATGGEVTMGVAGGAVLGGVVLGGAVTAVVGAAVAAGFVEEAPSGMT